MRKFKTVAVLCLSVSVSFADYPFDGVAESGTYGGELSGAFYHVGKDKLIVVDDCSKIYAFDPSAPDDSMPSPGTTWTNDLSGRDLEGITFKSSEQASDNICFLLDENGADPEDFPSEIVEYDLSGSGSEVRSMSIGPVYEVGSPPSRGPEALTWVPNSALQAGQQAAYGGGYFYVGWEEEVNSSGKNRVWVFRYTNSSLDELEQATSVSGLTDSNGTFLISNTPSAASEQFRGMHYDSASTKLWSLFADANFAQTVIVSDPDGSPSTVYTTGTISGSIEDWEGIATRSCPSAETYSLFTVSDSDTNGSIYGFDHCFPQIRVAESSKSHGMAGTFVIHVYYDNTECRSGGVSTLRVKFTEGVQDDGGGDVGAGNVSASSGTIGSVTQNDADTVTITFSSPPTNNAALTITFTDVVDAAGLALSDGICAVVALGDADNNEAITVIDRTFCSTYHTETTDATNFRCDLDVDGLIEWPSSGSGDDLDIWRDHLDETADACP